MTKKARRRAPGGGRKSLSPDGSDVVMLRIEPDLLKKVERLAEKHRRDRSKEIRAALRFWTSIYRKETVHAAELATLIEMLVLDIERYTGKRWMDDPATGTYVRVLIEQLIFHLAPTPKDRPPVPPLTPELSLPPDIGDILTFLLMRYEHQEYDDRVHDRSQELAIFLRDLGSGFRRNIKTWTRKAKP